MQVCKDKNKDNPGFPRYVVDEGGVKEAGESLCQFIDPSGWLKSIEGPQRPLLIVSFDESHILTDDLQDTGWTLFFVLRRVCRELVGCPIFFVFLSTLGRFNHFSPQRHADPSTRIARSDLFPLHPITEISFDDLALRAIENTVPLRRVVEMDWMCRLGRLLYVRFECFLRKQLNCHFH